jgi:hypothetical protein
MRDKLYGDRQNAHTHTHIHANTYVAWPMPKAVYSMQTSGWLDGRLGNKTKTRPGSDEPFYCNNKVRPERRSCQLSSE